MLTSKQQSFKDSDVIKTGLSDFHGIAVTVMKAAFQKLQPRVVNYRDYKYFENGRFRADLLPELRKTNIEKNKEQLFHIFFTSFWQLLWTGPEHLSQGTRKNSSPICLYFHLSMVF